MILTGCTLNLLIESCAKRVKYGTWQGMSFTEKGPLWRQSLYCTVWAKSPSFWELRTDQDGMAA